MRARPGSLSSALTRLGVLSSVWAFACGSAADSTSRSAGVPVDAGAGVDASPIVTALETEPGAAPALDDSREEIFEDPGCPALPPPSANELCDPLVPNEGCDADWACYPYVEYPSAPCEPERYGTRCEPAGPGRQGDDCESRGCAGGFLCVASGRGTICAELCALPGDNTCPRGLICGSLDIRGYGVCF